MAQPKPSPEIADLLQENRSFSPPDAFRAAANQRDPEIYARADPERHIDAGLSTGELGLRLRYEFRREFAPYVGVTWNRKFFGTADFARAAGEDTGGARVAIGVRTWF